MSGLAAEARRLTKAGIWIFPCKPGTKIPATKNGHKDSSNDPAQADKWWKENPEYNIGVDCGRSNIVVVDIDTKDGKQGDKSFDILAEGHPEVRETPTAITWSGGRHLWYQGDFPRTINAFKGEGLPDIDLCGRGGYVIAAPSVIREGGKLGTYRWTHEEGKRPPFLPFPDIFHPKEKAKILAPVDGAKIPNGERDTYLTSEAGKMHRKGATPSQLYTKLAEINQKDLEHPKSDADVRRIAKSIGRYPAGEDAPNPEDEDRKPLAVINASQASLEPVEWLWPGRIPLGLTTAIVGPEDAGKTFFYCALAAALSRGVPLPEAKEGFTCKSLLYHGEDLQTTIRDRLTRCGADLDRVQLINQEISSLSLRKLDTYLGEHPEVKLVVLDPVTVMLDGVKSDNNDTEVRRALLPLKALAEKHGIALLYLRHTGKNQDLRVKDKVLGAKGFIAVPRTVLVFLEDAETKRRFCFNEKNNLREKAAPVEYFISDDGFAWGDTDESVCAEAFAKSKPDPNSAKKRLKADEVIAWIRQTLDEGPMSANMILRLARANEIPERSLKRHKDDAQAVSERLGGLAEGGRWYWYLHDKLPKGVIAPQFEGDHAQISVVSDGTQCFGTLRENPDSAYTTTKSANRESMRAREGIAHDDEFRLPTQTAIPTNGAIHAGRVGILDGPMLDGELPY
jgi:hypothetical protein